MAQNTLLAVAFPTLDDEQIARVAGCIKVTPVHHEDGDILIKVGDRVMKFFIVKSGKIEIVGALGDMPSVDDVRAAVDRIGS